MGKDTTFLKIGVQFRGLSTNNIGLDKEKRTMRVSFSSEKPVQRWFGDEILSHDQKAVDLSRLNDGASLLWNHESGQVIGVVEKAEIGSDKRGYADIRFSKNPQAEQIMQDVADGIIRNVSFGYQVNEYQLTKKSKDGPDEYTATDWAIHEVSFVGVPADATIGVGRGQEKLAKEVVVRQLEIEQPNLEREILMPENIIDPKTIAFEAVKADRERTKVIQGVGERFKLQDLARQLIDNGSTIDEANAAFLKQMGVDVKPIKGDEANIGLDKKEIEQYSFVKAILALANPTDAGLQKAAAFEFETSEAAQKKLSKDTRGFMVPMDVLSASVAQSAIMKKAQRDLLVGTNTAGGYLVASELQPGSFVELLRNKSVFGQVGATMLTGLVGNILIPKATGAASFYMLAENGSITESQQTLGQISMTPKTGAALVEFSRKLLQQSSIGVEQFVRNDIANVIALGMDLKGLYGSGSSNEPTGLKNISGINTVDLATTPTWANILAIESAIAGANADVGGQSLITSAAFRGVLKGTVKVSGYPVYLWENDEVNGYPAAISNQVASGDIFQGVWSQFIMAMWGGLDILVDPYTNSATGAIRITAFQDFDVAVRHPESFCRANDVL